MRALFCLISCATTLPLPDVRQGTPYTCGASALQAVLAYYGQEAREDVLARELGATPEDGAPPQAIVSAARARGLSAELREHLSIQDLARYVAEKRPVVVAIQAWPDRPQQRYRDDWEDGHYVIVVGVTRERIIVEDPSVLGSRGWLGHGEFLERWHDEDKGVKSTRLGIVFDGVPKPIPSQVHVD
jgi:predicted double-glycine peptidase